ncbi:MAG TPA: hypothetical protein PKW57_02370 [Anaerolineaceae bacterium]|jgi:hypothetical protein|nr:hypothetical protein [Anaerolineaceae bacterium]HPS32323.1 hypothetical protein [Anaerolineaceae bacterium]
MNTKPKLPFPFYPLLFAAFPVLSLLGHNIQEVNLRAGLRPLLMILGGAVCVWLALLLATRSIQKAGLVSAWLFLLFYTYGRAYSAAQAAGSLFQVFGHHRILLPLWAVLAGVGAVLLLKYVKDSGNLSIILNVFSAFLLIIPVYQLITYEIRATGAGKGISQGGVAAAAEDVKLQPGALPDVYIIILDAHLRSDVLDATFHLDNTNFINQLTEMGFYVPPCSMSNYAYTPLSMSSFLNMQYLQDISPDFAPPNNDTDSLFELIEHNAVRKNLESLGYSTYSLASYQRIAWTDADHYYPLDPASLVSTEERVVFSKFERMLFDTTLVRILTDYKGGVTTSDKIPLNYPYADHVRQQWTILKELKQISGFQGPKLVWAHLTMPHAPYVFYPDGSLIPDPPELPWVVPLPWDQYLQYYSWGVQYTDNAILPVLEAILKNSDSPPIIVITGDHGADSANRLAVLSAFYVPDTVKAQITPDISLVNYFRVIFNGVYGANYEILENISYLSDKVNTFGFTLYPETMPDCMP